LVTAARAAIALHADRPSFGLGAVGLANSLPGALASTLGADFGARYPTAENYLARFGAYGCDYSALCGQPAMPLGLDVRNSPATPRVLLMHLIHTIPVKCTLCEDSGWV
jgi:hypothetical protein